MIKVVHATAAKGVPVSVAPGAVRAVLRSNGTVLAATPQMLQSLGRAVARTPGPQRATTAGGGGGTGGGGGGGGGGGASGGHQAAPMAGQLVAIPLNSAAGQAASAGTSSKAQLPVLPVVLR